MKEKLIKTMDLKNSMYLKFYDNSKKLAGDRWLVSLIVRMEIPVAEVSINDEGKSMGSVVSIVSLFSNPVLPSMAKNRR